MVIPLVVVHHFDKVRILGGCKDDINVDRIIAVRSLILQGLEELFCRAAAFGDHPLNVALKELLVLIVNIGVPMRTDRKVITRVTITENCRLLTLTCFQRFRRHSQHQRHDGAMLRIN